MLRVLKSLIKLFLKDHTEATIKYIKMYLLSLPYVGLRFKCPVCGGHFRTFLSAGFAHRKNAKCPRCRSLERHRLIWMFLKDRTNFFKDELRVLHFAPEFCLQRNFKSRSNLNYISADLNSPLATVQTDMTKLSFKDNTFDCILSIHVLEHISEDRNAMAELYRVLKPNGWAILQVPIMREETFEDANFNSPEQRLKHFGQEDHVRIYGSDYKDRLYEAGFNVKVDSYLSHLDENKVNHYRLVPENELKENIYFCYKPRNC